MLAKSAGAVRLLAASGLIFREPLVPALSALIVLIAPTIFSHALFALQVLVISRVSCRPIFRALSVKRSQMISTFQQILVAQFITGKLGSSSCREINSIDSMQLESYTMGGELFGGRLR